MSQITTYLLLLGIVITFQSTWGQRSSGRDRISLRDHLRHPSVRRNWDPAERSVSGISGNDGSLSLSSRRSLSGISGNDGSLSLSPRRSLSGISGNDGSLSLSPRRSLSGITGNDGSLSLSPRRGLSGSSRQGLLRSRARPRSRVTRRRLSSRRRTLAGRSSSSHSIHDSPTSLGRASFGREQLADRSSQLSNSFGDASTFNQQDSFSRRNGHSALVRSNHRQFSDVGIDHNQMLDRSLPARSPASHFEEPQFNIHHSQDHTMNTRSHSGLLDSNPSLARPSDKQTTRELIQDINLLLNLIGPADTNVNGAPETHPLPNQQPTPNKHPVGGGGDSSGLLNALITSHPVSNPIPSANDPSGVINSFIPAQSGFAQTTSSQSKLNNNSAKSVVPATKTVSLTTPAPAPNAVEALSQVLGKSVPKAVAARMVNEILPSELRILNTGSQKGVTNQGKGGTGQVNVRIVTEEPPEIDEILLREMLKKMRG